MKIRNENGYSELTAAKYVDSTKKMVVLTTEPKKMVVWKNNRPTDEVAGYSYWFIEFNGLEPFKIKFPLKLESLKFLDTIKISGLKACEVENSVYFKADNVG